MLAPAVNLVFEVDVPVVLAPVADRGEGPRRVGVVVPEIEHDWRWGRDERVWPRPRQLAVGVPVVKPPCEVGNVLIEELKCELVAALDLQLDLDRVGAKE